MPALPASLRVATSDSARDALVDAADMDRLRETISQRVVARAMTMRAKLELVEELSQAPATLDRLRAVAPALDEGTYNDLLEERHMEGRCPYPACDQPAATPYEADDQSAPAIKFKLRNDGGLYDATAPEHHDKGAYCSRQCQARSTWYLTKCIGTDRTEMLEDVEERRRAVARSARELREELQRVPDETHQGERDQSLAQSTQPPLPNTAQTSDLIQSLRITERSTPKETPILPSSSAPDFEKPVQSVPSFDRSLVTPGKPAAGVRKRPSPSRPVELFNATVDTRTRPVAPSLSSQYPVPPPPIRMPGQTDDEVPQPRFSSEPMLVDEQGNEVEWVADLDDEGESDEVKAWMEEALRVRQMVRDGRL